MAATTDVSALTISLTTFIQAVYAVILVGLGVVGWLLQRSVAKQDETVKAVQEDVVDLQYADKALEDKMRAELRAACAEAQRQHERLRDECKHCIEDRRKEYTDCVDTYGKFGSRLSRLEGEHAQQHGKC